MASLTEFLLARVAEDEAEARRAAFGYGAGWTNETDDVEDWSVVHADGKRDMVGCEDGDVTGHIARWDPARVLAECEAKRRLIAATQEFNTDPKWDAFGAESEYERLILTNLALPYADHPDYREDWKPEGR